MDWLALTRLLQTLSRALDSIDRAFKFCSMLLNSRTAPCMVIMRFAILRISRCSGDLTAALDPAPLPTGLAWGTATASSRSSMMATLHMFTLKELRIMTERSKSIASRNVFAAPMVDDTSPQAPRRSDAACRRLYVLLVRVGVTTERRIIITRAASPGSPRSSAFTAEELRSRMTSFTIMSRPPSTLFFILYICWLYAARYNSAFLWSKNIPLAKLSKGNL